LPTGERIEIISTMIFCCANPTAEKDIAMNNSKSFFHDLSGQRMSILISNLFHGTGCFNVSAHDQGSKQKKIE
jgi:hypothetical protein